jgi:hypothetical protein
MGDGASRVATQHFTRSTGNPQGGGKDNFDRAGASEPGVN